jgi:GTP cyclohydrolase II
MRPQTMQGAMRCSASYLRISSIRLLTAAKHRYVGLAGFGIEIVSTEPIEE